MREKHRNQRALTEPWLELPYAKELREIDSLLAEQPTIGELAAQDLSCKASHSGRPGISGEEVIRALVLKQINQYSYDELWFQIHDSQSARTFMGYGIGERVPSRSTLATNIKKLRPETLQEIGRIVISVAMDRKIETGRKVRVDTTPVGCNIHEPVESGQLWDVVRVLVRLMGTARRLAGDELNIVFADRTRRAKRRSRAAWYANTKAKRKQHYRDLLKVTREVMNSARRVSAQLADWRPNPPADRVKANRLCAEMNRVLVVAERLCDTTTRRVIHGESVPAGEKVLSIFEEHADLIVKDRRDTYFGHKICLTGGKSSMILDCRVLDANPADSTIAVDAVKAQKHLFKRVPRQITFDGGFFSKSNVALIKNLGVHDVVFSKHRGVEISEMAKSTWVFRRLRDFRAGIEGNISFLKRAFGLDRCNWRGLQSFNAYVQASILSFNLLILARHLMN